MNIYNRSMFANGDEVSNRQTLPMYQGHAESLGNIDKFGNVKSNIFLSNYAAEIDPGFGDFLDRYGIDAETYAFIHKEAGNPVDYVDDPGIIESTPGLDLIGGKGILKLLGKGLFKKTTQGTGNYVAETLPMSVAGPTRGLQEITENVTKLTPIGRSVTAASTLPFLSGSTTISTDDEVQDNLPPFIAENQDDVQAEIDLLESKDKKALDKKKAKANKIQLQKEIKDIQDEIFKTEAADTKESEQYQLRKKQRTGRNANIFLEEMALSMAGTNNLADGLAIGAANAASKVGDADEAEELEKIQLAKDLLEENTPKDLKEPTVLKIIEDYGEQVGSLEGSLLLDGKINELKEMLLDPSKNISGLGGFLQGFRAKFEGAFGQDGTLLDRSKAQGIVRFLQARMVQDLLDEKGKTISDADRLLIKELLGNLESTVSNRADIINLLNNVSANLNNSIIEQRRFIKIYDKRYSSRIPELEDFKSEFNYVPTKDAVRDDEVSIADDPTVIQ